MKYSNYLQCSGFVVEKYVEYDTQNKPQNKL